MKSLAKVRLWNEMAGINQHYLPKFLQRGFVSSAEGEPESAWVFHTNSAPKNEPLKKIGVESGFYNDGADTSVDDEITKAENHYANAVNRLRTGSPRTVDEVEIPKLLSNLEVRSRHLRQTFVTSGTELISRLIAQFTDSAHLAEVIVRRNTSDPKWLRLEAERALRERGVASSDLSAAIDLVVKMMLENLPSMMAAIRPGIDEHIRQVRASLPSVLPMLIKQGHIRALKKSIAPPVRLALLESFTYRVVDAEKGGFVLGDCACFFRINRGNEFRPWTEKGDEVHAVYLPLSHRRLLVGERIETALDSSEIRAQAACCSLEYFVANADLSESRSLQCQIGRSARRITDQEISEMAVEVFESFANGA